MSIRCIWKTRRFKVGTKFKDSYQYRYQGIKKKISVNNWLLDHRIQPTNNRFSDVDLAGKLVG